MPRLHLNIGPKSVLFGAHCFFLHPLFVAWGWKKLYGWPLDPRLWFVFFVHDLGYLFYNTPNMDGEEGERHPEWAANLTRRLFGDTWGDLVLYHSRFYAKKNNRSFSRLCVADKLAFCLEPRWLYLTRVHWSKEDLEYTKLAHKRGLDPNVVTVDDWYYETWLYLHSWVEHHKDLREDTWSKIV